MNRILIYILVAFLPVLTIAQNNVEFDKKSFPTRKDALKEALSNIKEGDGYYHESLSDDGTYVVRPSYMLEAMPFYKKAYAFNSNNALLNYKIGDCYMVSEEKQKAIRYYQKAVKLNYKVRPDIHFKLGRALQINYRFDEAITHFEKYRGNLQVDEIREKDEMISKKVDECNVGKSLVADSVRVFIDNIGAVNSEYPEFGAFVSADESFMVFTSRRPGSVGDKIDGTGQYYEDVYYSTKDSSGWSSPKNIGEGVNTKDHDAVVGLSADGQRLFMYYGQQNSGDLMVSHKEGEKWSKPKPLAKTINTSYGNESSAAYSFDNKTIFFTTDNEDGVVNHGQHDIFKVTLNEKGKWGKPENMGAIINSKYSEVDIFMHADGRTMYFASNGHKTMGGYDIFKTERSDDGTWSEPENMGYPINTPLDDRLFVVAGSGRRGYYSSAKEGGKGRHDLYMITFLGPEKQLIQSNEDNLIASQLGAVKEEPVFEEVVEIKTSRLTIVKGIVIDGFTDGNPPLEADIEIADNATGEVISTIKSNSATGHFLLTLPSGKDYGIAVKKEGYLFHSENFNIPQTSEYQEIELQIKLLKLEKDSKIVLKNVFFETASSNLDPKSYKELDLLIKILTDYPNMKIEISGHTDNEGSRTTNLKLSEKRAQSVVTYLSKDISVDRMVAKGYAFDEPIADNATAEGRAQNRRVEFKILSNETPAE